MRTLYLPTEGRRTSEAKQLLENTVQDNVRTDPDSRMHAVANAVAAEFERAFALSTRTDARPWAADVRTPGVLETADGSETEVKFDDMLYGPPTKWEPSYLRRYEYYYDEYSGIITEDGHIATPYDVDRAVETPEGLVIQVGSNFYRFTEDDEHPAELTDVPNIERPVLVSPGEERYHITPGITPTDVEVSCQIEGLNFLLGGGGSYEISLTYKATATVQDGDDLSQLTDYDTPGYLYDGDTRVDYTLTGTVINTPQIGYDYLLHYQAERSYSYESPKADRPAYELTHRLSFQDVASNLFRLPTEDNIAAYQKTDRLCRVDGGGDRYWVDANGFVGEAAVGHEIRTVLPTRYHTVVADRTTVTLVEHDAQTVPMSQDFRSLHIIGVTWTQEGELGIVTASDIGFDVLALRDVRDQRSGDLTPTEPPITDIPPYRSTTNSLDFTNPDNSMYVPLIN